MSNENARAGRWTKVKPDREGYYWLRWDRNLYGTRHDYPPLVYVGSTDGNVRSGLTARFVLRPLESVGYGVANDAATEWFGPIAAPEYDATEAGDAKGGGA